MATYGVLPQNPNIGIMQNFVDNFLANERARQQQAIQQQQVDQAGQYQQGQLKYLNDQFELAKQKATDEQTAKMVAPWAARWRDAHVAMDSTSDPQEKMRIQAQMDAEKQNLLAEHPEYKPYLVVDALAPIMTPARQAQINAGKYMQSETGQGAASPVGSAINIRLGTGDFPTQQMTPGIDAEAINARRAQGTATPNVTAKIPTPSTDAVSNQAMVGAGLMPGAPDQLRSQTELQQTAMQQAGAMARQKQQQEYDTANTPQLFGGIANMAPAGAPGSADIKTAPAVIQALVNRQLDPSFVRYMGRTPEGMQQLNQLETAVRQYAPNFSMAEYPTQVANLKEYSQAGQTGKSITAISTAIRHLDTYLDNLKGMNNTRFPAVNTVGNFLQTQGGNQNLQRSQQATDKAAQLVAREIERAVKGSSQYGEKDVQQMSQGLSANATPGAGLGAVSGAIQLLAGRLDEIANSYTHDTGLPASQLLSDPRIAGVRSILAKMKQQGVEGTDDLLGAAASPSPSPSPAPGPNADQQFISAAMQTINPATGRNYTQAEAAAYLAKRKGGG